MDHQSAVDGGWTERYILGELDAPETAEFEEHFFECPVCAADVRKAALFAENLKATLGEADSSGKS